MALQADEFTGSALDGSWTFVDPVGDCSVTVDGSMAQIAVPSGTAHATDNDDNQAPYIYQTTPDVDLDVQAKFDSTTRKGQGNIRFQGLICYDAAGADRVGFIAFCTSTSNALFAFSNVGGGAGTVHLNTNLNTAVPSHLRLVRVGDQWTVHTSTDGTTWTQQAQFTLAMTVARAGILTGNATNNPAFTSRIDWWHVGTPSVPTAPSVVRATLFTDEFLGDDGDPPDPTHWVVDNGPGGSATIQGNELRLRHTDAEGSSGAIYTVEQASNIGVLMRYRFADTASPPHWLVPGFSANQTPALHGGGDDAAEGFGDLYSPDYGYVTELGGENDLARPFRVDQASFPDGTYVYSTYLQLDEVAATSSTDWRWLRQERLQDLATGRGLLRMRTWADGSTEPDTWDAEVWDGLHEGPGRFYLSYGNNAASGPVTRDAFVDEVTVYQLSVLAEEEPSPPVSDESEEWIGRILDAVVTEAQASGWFNAVLKHEPVYQPGQGMTCSIWVQAGPDPLPGASGLSASSALLTLFVRIYTPLTQEPRDEIEPNMTKAVSNLMRRWHGDYDFGLHPLVRNVDLLGESGTRLQSKAGYVQFPDRGISRVKTITLPIICNDIWPQAGGA